ncbi:MAG: polyisoprenyl-phosphate glycosyltransferase [Verrucomicrobiota bacterium]
MEPASPISTESLRLVSLVIPVFNESAVLPELMGRLNALIKSEPGYRWEIIFVDDGSTDETFAKVIGHGERIHAPLRAVRLSRNFGHQAALTAGLLAARGDAVIALDADLQDPPELVGAFLRKYEEGYDVVYGVRTARAGDPRNRIAYTIFYRLFQRVAEIAIPLDAGDFGLMSKAVAGLVVSMPERDIFVRGLRSWVGFRQIGVPYERPERAAGETKYSFSKLLKLAASAFFGFSFLPLRIATSLGLVTVLLSVLYSLFAICAAIFFNSTPRGWASMVAVISLIGGAQLVCIGILGEYIGRIYKQTLGRPLFIVAEQRELGVTNKT